TTAIPADVFLPATHLHRDRAPAVEPPCRQLGERLPKPGQLVRRRPPSTPLRFGHLRRGTRAHLPLAVAHRRPRKLCPAGTIRACMCAFVTVGAAKNPLFSSHLPGRRTHLSQRDLDLEAAPGDVPARHVCAHALRETAHEREAEAGPLAAPRGLAVDAVEG